jgi:hypothetical protein
MYNTLYDIRLRLKLDIQLNASIEPCIISITTPRKSTGLVDHRPSIRVIMLYHGGISSGSSLNPQRNLTMHM